MERKCHSKIGRQKERTIISEIDGEREEETHGAVTKKLFNFMK